ncbi:MAG: inositol monophosphatase [Desulfotalea sp.]
MLTFIKEIAFRAGSLAQQEQGGLKTSDISFKSARDLVSRVDILVEEFLVSEVRSRYPNHAIIGEEGGRQGESSTHCWYIDPIDGTTSYCHGLPGYSVSIGYEKEGQMIAAAVFAPEFKQMFLAERGAGATLNGKKISVSSKERLIESVLATGFTCMRNAGTPSNIPIFNELLPKIRDFRRMGSAAIDLAYVAAGKLDGFWELNLNSYDVAAGALLVQEAGGEVVDFNGGGDYPKKGIVATNPFIKDELLGYLGC